MKLSHIRALEAAAAARRPVAFCTRLPDGLAYILPDLAAPAELNEAGATALAAGRTGTVEIAGQNWFIEARNPAPRIIIVGAVHIAQAFAPLAAQAGFEAIIIDPRRAFATEARFPGIKIRTEWPDEAIDALVPDATTAIVTLTHDPKFDDPALLRALRSNAFYIGALGSARTHAKRLDRLREAGIPNEALARISAPIGLDIGARTAPEIAVSIIAEIIAARHGKFFSRDQPK